MFEGFETQRVEVSETQIFLRRAGTGSPLLLLHGYPQTHVMWHRVAPALAARHTVICPDLRGYGDSGKPPSDAGHIAYSKRRMAQDLVEMMAELGFERFAVAGHDRGGRVTHRMCLDHPERIVRAAVLDIVPTDTLYRGVNQAIATGYYHWFFLIQPAPFPERLIGADPTFFLHHKLGSWGPAGLGVFAPEALAEYERCFRDPMIHASCEDYRAGASIDLDHLAADGDRQIGCPLLVLWGENGLMHRQFDVLATWRERARQASGQALPCGHYLAEELPTELMAQLIRFFAQGT